MGENEVNEERYQDLQQHQLFDVDHLNHIFCLFYYAWLLLFDAHTHETKAI